MSRLAGRQFLNIPGPTNIPDRVLQAMHRPALDFQAPEFIEVQQECLVNLKKVMKTDAEMMVYASTGHGSGESEMTNIYSPGVTMRSSTSSVAQEYVRKYRYGGSPDN